MATCCTNITLTAPGAAAGIPGWIETVTCSLPYKRTKPRSSCTACGSTIESLMTLNLSPLTTAHWSRLQPISWPAIANRIHGCPGPSYDLWEERFGILTYTTSAVYAGLD